jgi:Type III flagellar switch regulator (C-ring) FliN C-term
MSVEAVVARVEQLHQLVSAAAAPGGNGGQDFASQLTAATTAALPAASVASAPATTLAAPVTTTPSALPPGVPYGAEITAAAQRNGIDPALLAALVRQESNFVRAAPRRAGRARRRDRTHAHDDRRDAGARAWLDHHARPARGEPVDLLVNGKPIARGEVVVIDEEFGLRVTEVVTGGRRPVSDAE